MSVVSQPAADRGAGIPAVARSFWWLLLAVAAVWFLTLDARHLLRPDEGRYAEIAREMFVSGDWVTIRYNGLKYFEKPPFHLWMTALAYTAFGVGEWQARLWVAVSGAGGLLATAYAARRWFGREAALLTACVLLASPAWSLGGHFNALDMSVSGALACVLAAVLVAQHPDTSDHSRRRWMLVAWAAVAVAILTKGLIGIVLPALVTVVYSLLARDRGIWRRLHIGWGALLMLVITAPWFVLVTLRNPEFPQFFFIHEHWQRYTSTVHHRSAPFWYFVPIVLLGFLPWTGLFWKMTDTLRMRTSSTFRPAWYLATWAASIFVFFSLSGSKLPGYVLPVFPALAILAALALEQLAPKTWNRYVMALVALVVLALFGVPFMDRLGSDDTNRALFTAYEPWLAVAGASALVGLGVALYQNDQGRKFQGIVAVAMGFFAAFTIALLGHETFGRSNSGIDLVAPIQAVATPDMPIYSVRMLDHTLPFYLGHTTIMVESLDELEFGARQEPDKWLPTLADFESAWRTPQKALAIMGPDTFRQLSDAGLFMVPVAKDDRRVVVANFPKASP